MRALTLATVISMSECLLLGAGTVPGEGGVEREALFEQIVSWQAFPDSVPLEAVIEALSGHKVLDWEGEAGEGLAEVAEWVLASTRETPLSAKRPNEIGNKLEAVVRAAIEARGWQAERPAGPSGRRRSAGYPDLEFTAAGRAFYLEIKAFSPQTEHSTQRTFYLSPSRDFKVTRDAFHLLLACEIVALGEGEYNVRSVRWLDLHTLECRLKHEFNASNRDLYSDGNGLVILERHEE